MSAFKPTSDEVSFASPFFRRIARGMGTALLLAGIVLALLPYPWILRVSILAVFSCMGAFIAFRLGGQGVRISQSGVRIVYPYHQARINWDEIDRFSLQGSGFLRGIFLIRKTRRPLRIQPPTRSIWFNRENVEEQLAEMVDEMNEALEQYRPVPL